MKQIVKLLSFSLKVIILSYLSSVLVVGQTVPVSTTDDDDEELYDLTPFTVDAAPDVGYSATNTLAGTRMSGDLGATVGGSQGINYFVDQVLRGQIPDPDTITAEGLFSQHDLPIHIQAKPGQLLTVGGEAMEASLLCVPDAKVLAQIGFGSGLDARTWEPAPINLVALVDKSGSMGGQPLELVKQSLRHVVNAMEEGDQISIVTFGSHSQLILEQTPISKRNRSQILSTISGIHSSGSTAMEEGLKLGYQVAKRSARAIDGNTRIMLFTDEQPNVGNTSPGGFMAQMREGSKVGVGLTTIGVGVHYGAELAQKISAVRGGNLYYFSDYTTMVETFEEEFDTMVTELAYDMNLTITPAKGWKIEGVYGIPGDMLEWTNNDSIRMRVETLFLSRKKGAIFFALSPENTGRSKKPVLREGASVARVDLSYIQNGDLRKTHQSIDFSIEDRRDVGAGLKRGEALVSQYAGLKQATSDFHQRSDYRSAYRTLKSLSRVLRENRDRSLKNEWESVDNLAKNVRTHVGYYSEIIEDEFKYPISGVWNAYSDENPDIETDFILTLTGDCYLELAAYDDHGYVDEVKVAVAKKRFSKYGSGKIEIRPEEDVDYLDFDAPFELEDADYLSNIFSIKYKIHGDEMEAKIYRNKQPSPLTIRFERGDEVFNSSTFTSLDDVQVDPISGLPIR